MFRMREQVLKKLATPARHGPDTRATRDTHIHLYLHPPQQKSSFWSDGSQLYRKWGTRWKLTGWLPHDQTVEEVYYILCWSPTPLI